jgi:hypothetical protein
MERNDQNKEEPKPHRVRLPGFITNDDEIGLGDVVTRAT